MKPLKNSAILFVLIFLSIQITWAQLENANWYFGEHAGLNFENTTTVLTDGQTNSIYSETASISDSNGNLLFYTDGHTVWNKNHQIMENGTSNLSGSFSSPVIIPFPGTTTKYYIFSIRYYFQQWNKSQYIYSIVDMDSDNGLGSIVVSQQSLGLLPVYDLELSMNRYVEKSHMTVAKHSDGESFWLILNPFYNFYVYKIDINGISSTPIIKETNGHHYDGLECETKENGSANMVISPDSSKIAFLDITSTPLQSSGFCNDSSYLDMLLIYNFNNTNGTITDYYINGNYDWLGNLNFASSVEFSSNSQFLYVLGTSPNKILQYDLNNISNIPISIFENYGYFENSEKPILHRAINGKIYVPTTNPHNISVINNPNDFGVNCNFVENQIDFGNNRVQTLPALVPIHENSCIVDLTITTNVNSNQTDIQKSSNSITATNTIFNGATATYDAGETVYLKPNFHAKYGSNFRAFIEGCTGRTNIKKSTKVSARSEIINSIQKEETNYVVTYPNPTKDILAIKTTKEVSSWVITNAYGKQYFNGNGTSNIDMGNLPNGIYFLKAILTNGKVVIKKMVKN